MEYRFYNENLRIGKVVELVRDFFEKNGFKVSVNREDASSFTIVSKNPYDSLFPRIIVKVCSKKDFLSVNFLESDELHSKMFLSLIFSFFGGNFFLLKDSKIKEKIDRLEEGFWKYLEPHL